MPPLPKHAPQRRNKTTSRATLSPVHDVEAPELPDDRMWHPQTLKWWNDTWASPMAPEYDPSDVHGLFVLAVLIDDFWVRPTWALAAEIRLQRQCFGLSPIDRRRLQWEIEKVDEAVDRGRRRRATAPPAKKPPKDPLAALRAV